MYWCHCVDFT